MKQIKIFLIIVIIIFFACQKKVNFNIDYPAAKSAVNCLVNPDSTIKVYLTKSLTPVDTINFKDITNAKIEIFKNGIYEGLADTHITPEKNPGLGYYTNPLISFSESDSLKIIISHPDFEKSYAYTSIPQKPSTDTDVISYTFEGIENPQVNGYNLNASIKISIFDSKNEERYYSVKMYYYANDLPYLNNKDTIYKDKIHFTINSEKVIKTYNFNEGYIFANKDFDSNNQTFYLYVEDQMNVKSSEFFKLYIVVNSICKDYYLYQKTLKGYYESINNPFGEPVKVYSNINNGYGIFAGYNSVIDTVTLIENM